MAKNELLAYLVQKPQQDPAKLAAFDARFRRTIADVFAPVHEDIRELKHREYWLKGGRGSCKSSYASCEIISILYHDPKASALVLRKVGVTMRDTVYSQMLWALEALGVLEEWETTVSPMEMTNIHTGQKIMFRGLDEPRKIKSIKPKRGYFGVVWFEEAEEYKGITELRSVMQSVGRGKGAQTVTLVSYNPPRSAGAWVNEEVLKPKADRLVHHSTYLEVPREWLGDTFWAEAEALRASDELAWRHEYGGEVTGTGGAVFANLKLRPLTAEELGYCKAHPMYGLDYGYSIDPCALISESYLEYPDGRKVLILYDEWYMAGAGIEVKAKALRKQCGEGQIWCDVYPEVTAELVDRGIRIAAARKGPKSRIYGMQWLEELTEIVIDPARCPNAAKEFVGFEHAKDTNGRWRADYQDGNDHTIDAARYGAWPVIYRNKRTKYYSGRGGRT